MPWHQASPADIHQGHFATASCGCGVVVNRQVLLVWGAAVWPLVPLASQHTGLGGRLRTARCMPLRRACRLLCWVASVLRLASWPLWPPARSSTGVLWAVRRTSGVVGRSESFSWKFTDGTMSPNSCMWTLILVFNAKAPWSCSKTTLDNFCMNNLVDLISPGPILFA